MKGLLAVIALVLAAGGLFWLMGGWAALIRGKGECPLRAAVAASAAGARRGSAV